MPHQKKETIAMTQDASESIYRLIALQFEETNLNTPELLALFENLYDVSGAEAVRGHPRFKALLGTFETLLFYLENTEGPHLEQLARTMVEVHEHAGVSPMMFVMHGDRIEDLIREEGGHPLLLKNFRLLKYAVAKLHDEFIKAEASRKQAALLEALNALMKTMPVGFFTCDIETGAIYDANPAFLTMLGYGREELLGKTWYEITPTLVVQRELEENEALLKGDISMIRREKTFITKDGAELPVILYFGKLFDPRVGKEVYIDFAVDVSELKKAQKMLDEAYHYFYEVFDQTNEMLAVFDSKGGILEVNQAVEALFGYSKKEVLAPEFDWWRLFHPEENAKILAHLKLLLETGQPQRLEIRGVRKEGSVIELFASYRLFNGFQSGPPQILGVHVDISPVKRLEAELRYLSFHDTLTGLFNRAYFEQELKRLSKGRTAPVGVVVLDVDNLKPANDTLGHQAGDALLRRAAEVLKKVFRAEDVIARLGGDEFAALLLGADGEALKGVLTRLEKAIARDNETRPESRLSLSAGFAFAPQAPFQHEALFQSADRAMYQDKIARKRALSNGKSLPNGDAGPARAYRASEATEKRIPEEPEL